MISFVFVLFSTGMATAAAVLFVRLLAVRKTVSINPRASGLNAELMEIIARASDDSLFLKTGAAGLEEIEIVCREYQDPYRNLKELLPILEKYSGTSEYSEINSCIKGLYQIQLTLGLPIDAIDSALRWLEARLQSCTVFGKSIARSERVNPGALLDSKKMLAINNGTHVKQPLGVVCVDAEGKVLSKAKVICS